MLPEPLHPILVHFPIALTTFLLPLAVYGWIASHRRPGRHGWVPVAVLAALALATALLAQQAGDREEDRVEPWVSESVLEHHEERAELFVWSLAIVFGCSLMGLAARRVGQVGRALTVAVLIPAAVLVFLVGDSGGDLVYKHGAAAAYNGSPEARLQPRTGPSQDH